MPKALYLTVAEVRAEGEPFADDLAYEDTFVEGKIRLASQQIEDATGNWFAPLSRVLVVDGRDSKVLQLKHPIVKITEAKIIYASHGADPDYTVNLEDLTVYNRHLRQGLDNPNDRKNPRLVIDDYLDYPIRVMPHWPSGRQNIQVTGTFGWTELNETDTVGEKITGHQEPESEGSTPERIKRVCMLLVRRLWPKMSETDDLIGATRIGDLTKMKTRDHEFVFGSRQTAGSDGIGLSRGLTGDPEIDQVLLDHRCIPGAAWAA